MNYSNITGQDIVNMVWSRLNDGTGRALHSGGGCSYLSDDGLKCAVGIFIPDGHRAQKSTEYLGPMLDDNEHDCQNEPWHILLKKNEEVLRKLQYLHDDAAYWDGNVFNNFGKRNFRELCEILMLKYPGGDD